MGRPTTKSDLIEAATQSYGELNALISSLNQKEMATPFDFTGQNKKEAHWERDKNLRDVLIHLYEWHRLLLDWAPAIRNGENRPFLPAPYTWRTYGEMNKEFWKKHQNTSLDEAKEMLDESHRSVMALAETFSNEELFTKGVYPCCGTGSLGSYFVSNLSSHYQWAIKKIKAHRKNCKLALI